MISIGEPVSASGQELLAEFMQYGHQRPFEEIVRRYAGMVFNVCYRVTKDKHEAEDATQAVFLTLALQVKRGTEIKALGPWLQQVGKRLALDMRRSKKRRKTREERHHDEQTFRRESLVPDDGVQSADLDEVKTILHEELNKLPTKYRMPLILHYFGGLTRDEMAVELNCKASTLGVRIFRGREMLAGRLSSRGVSISLGTFSVMMAYLIRSAVSDSMVSSTSHAATAMIGGHNGLGLVSSRVIGLSRRASGAMMIGKLKLATILLIVASTSVGAGAKALGVLPTIDVRQIISNQIYKLVRPVTQQISIPLRADAAPVAPKATQPQVAYLMPVHSEPATPAAEVAPKVESKSVPGLLAANFVVQTGTSTSVPTTAKKDDSAPAIEKPTETQSPGPVFAAAGTVPTSQAPISTPLPVSNSSTAKVNTGPSFMAGVSPAAVRKSNSVRSTVVASVSGFSGPGMTASAADDLVVGSIAKTAVAQATVANSASSGSDTSSSPTTDSGAMSGGSSETYGSAVTLATANGDSATTALPAMSGTKIIRVAAENGNVTLSGGVLRGYGEIKKTGTLQVSGQVVADGHGIDRTLDLTSFKNIQSNVPSSEYNTTSGWYAQAHGRLTLALQASADGSSYIWGGSPGDSSLSLVNSVRFTPLAAGLTEPPELSLVSVDRCDVPPLTGITSTPLSLWQVDSSQLPGLTDLTIRYDPATLDQTSAVELWTYSDGSWQMVSPASFEFNPAEHLVSGTATDFSYFAVTTSDSTLPSLQATPGDERAPSVPEPVGIGMLALASTMLVRRRRRQV